MAKKTTKTSVEPKSAMYYPEHEKTYEMFLSLTKWCTIGCIAAVIALAVYGFTGAGVFGALLSFVIISALAAFFA